MLSALASLLPRSRATSPATRPAPSAPWMREALEDLERTVSAPGFPCLFGRKALASKRCVVAYASREAPAVEAFEAICKYLDEVRELPARDRILRPLILFFEEREFAGLLDQQAYAWSILQQLHEQDAQPWPQHVARDPRDPAWAFCLAGTPLFLNMSFPGHRQMKSRNLGRYITFVINLRENFDLIAAGNAAGGQRVREAIRERIRAYNQGVMPDTLGCYGQDDNLEWRQYQLWEPEGLRLWRCPLKLFFGGR